MPDNKRRFHLYSDTSKFTTRSALHQIQDGKPKLIAYTSKRLPKAARNYSITELETCGLAINIASFVHLLKKVDLNAIVDHLALTHIIRSKAELTTTRIKRQLEVLSYYSFHLYYIKGKDMILSDFLSRQEHDASNPYEIKPISFNMQSILQTRCYNLGKGNQGKYLVQRRVTSKSSSIKLPDVHGVGKGSDPNIQPEKQFLKPLVVKKVKEVSQTKPMLGQGRAGLRYKIKMSASPLASKPIA